MKLRRTISCLLATILLISTMPFAVSATEYNQLNVNWDNINTTGYQTVSGPCFCYALAYCRDILDEKSHSWTEYSLEYLSSKGRYSYTAMPSKASYSKKTASSTSTVYKAVYDQIKLGRPVVVNVSGGRSSGCHYIAVVGYTNVSSTSSLSASNFLIIDSALKKNKTATENMGTVGYSLRKAGGVYSYYTTNSGYAESSGDSNVVTVEPKISFNKSSISLGLNSNTSTTVTATIEDLWNNAGWTTSSVYDVYKQSQDGNKITFSISAKSTGSSNFTLTSYDSNGKSLASASINISVSGATLSASASSLNLNLNGTNTSTITLTAGGNLPSNYYISYATANGNCALSYGNWSGNSIPFTVTGKSGGSDTLNFSLKNSANNSVIATKTVSVSIDVTTYTVAYNANGGSNAPSSQTKTYGKDLTLSSVVPTGKTYTVTFNGNGGTVATSSKQYTQRFVAWNTNSSGTATAYQPGGTYTNNSDITLYAKWENPKLSVSDPTRSGYYFLGWYDSTKVDSYGLPLGKRYTLETKLTSNLTLHAMWSTSPIMMYGDYDLDGQIKPIDITAFNSFSLGKIGDIDEELKNQICFRGDVDADGDVDGNDVTIINQVRTGTINYTDFPSYKIIDGFYIMDYPKTKYEYGESLDITGLSAYIYYTTGTFYFFKTDFSVSGYDPYKIGLQTLTVNFYQYSDTFTVTVNPPKYTLNYDANGGTVSSVGKSVTYNSAIGTLPTPTREGYTFLGWSYTKNSSSYLTSSTIYSYMENKTVYANWKADTYSVTYNTNGGVGTPTSDIVTYPNSYTVNATTLPTKQGYTFLGWSTDSSASQPTYLPGVTAAITSNTVLYAVWQASDILIEEDELHNNISFANQARVVKFVPVNSGIYSIYSNGEIPLIATLSQGTDTKTETDTSGNFKIRATLIKGTAYYITVKSSSTGHFSLFADWIPSECEVSMYDTINNESDVIIVLEGEDLLLPTPQKDGYTFDGWYTSAIGGSKIASSITVTEDIKIYSHWTQNVLLGDVNGDGIVDAGDAVIISRYDAGLITLTADQLKVGDVNGDGTVDAGDAVIISRYDAGLISKIK